MPITVRIEDERGTCLGDTWVHSDATRLLTGEHPGTCCLRFIDPYGDALFNQLQLPVLIAELRALDAREPEPSLRMVLHSLVTFIEPAIDELHTYVRFVGD
jgi:hypothetical protein